jgi:hypothetical protein
MLVNTLTRLDGVLAAMPSPVSEPVGGPSAQNMKPGVYFDMLASPNGFTDSHPFDPSAFEGVSPVEPDKEPARPVKGLQRVKRAVRLFEGPLSVFDTWRARLRTDKGVYEIVGPKRIDRHLCDEYGWIEL